MTYVMFSGCFLLVFGPAAAIYGFVLMPKPVLTVTMIASAFFWLLISTLTSLWWVIIPPLRVSFVWVVLCSALTSEAGRYMFFRSFSGVFAKLAERGAPPLSPLEKLRYAVASGLGFGVLHAMTNYLGFLMEARGPGSVFTPGCSATSLFLVNGLSALAFLLFDVAAMVVAFYGYERQRLRYPGFVAGARVLASLWTLLFRVDGLCGLGMFTLYATVAAVGAAMVLVLIATVREEPPARDSGTAVPVSH